MTKEHLERKANIGSWAMPPKGTSERDGFEKMLRKKWDNPEYRKEIKKLHDKAVARISAQTHNGLNFPIDKELRYFLNEYNNRNMTAGLNSMPLNFNIMEAFFDHNPAAASFALKDEEDHLVSFVDFFEYFTSPVCDAKLDCLLDVMKENTIYSYTNLDNIDTFTFSTEPNDEYALAGFSMVRDGNEISILFLSGKKTDTIKLTQKLLEESVEIVTPNIGHPDKVDLKPDRSYKLQAAPLLDDKNYWKCMALSRFDLSSSTIDARYIMFDCGRFYDVSTDDPQGFLNMKGDFDYEDKKSIYEMSLSKMKAFHAVFETSKTLLMLPLYLDHFSENVKIERHITELGKKKGTYLWAKKINLLSKNQKIYYRDLIVLDPRTKRYPSNSTFYAPNIKIETKGFWKKLPPGTIGKDKNGNDIHGKTWVTQNLSWFEDDTPPSALNIAKNITIEGGENSGTIYLMRCAAHEKDILKIGLTRRTSEIRAAELTRNTSSPDTFLVAHEWQVNDCVLAEKLIHEKLSKYRINPQREFFKVDYKIVFNYMDEIIGIVNKC